MHTSQTGAKFDTEAGLNKSVVFSLDVAQFSSMSGSAPATRYRRGGDARHCCDRRGFCVPTSSPPAPPKKSPSMLTPVAGVSDVVRANANIEVRRRGRAANAMIDCACSTQSTAVVRVEAFLRGLSSTERAESRRASSLKPRSADAGGQSRPERAVARSSSANDSNTDALGRFSREEWRDRVRGASRRFPFDWIGLASLFRQS